MSRLRIGTRGSALALAQAGQVARRLREVEPTTEVELHPIRTSGDERHGEADAPTAGDQLGEPAVPAALDAPASDKSRFVKEIEEALLAGEIDLAVHSAKDVPGVLPRGLAIVAVPERIDPRDALCGAPSLSGLPGSATVGTSSLRRRAQLLALRPDLRIEELRGNVDTRLRRLERGEYTAIVLAGAGLARLAAAVDAGASKLARRAGAPIPVDEMTPAPGQGCLLLEARSDDAHARSIAERLTDCEALVRLTAERALVTGLEATCRTPVGGLAELRGGRLALAAFVGLPDGSVWMRDALEGTPGEPADLGREVAERLLAAGADELLAAAEAWQPGA